MEEVWTISTIVLIIMIGLIIKLLIQTKQRMNETHFGKALLITLWLQWEKLFQWVFRVKEIDNHDELLSLRVKNYRGKPIQLKDGNVLKRGDRVAELHLNNEKLFAISTHIRTPVQLAVQLIHGVDKEMPKIAGLLQHHPTYQHVKGLYGVSLINRGTKKFGFSVVDLPKGPFFIFSRMYLRLLLYILHPEGKKRLKTKKELLVPKTIAISKADLLKRYGDSSVSESKKESVIIKQVPKIDHSKA